MAEQGERPSAAGFHLLAIPGSLRQQSVNRGLADAAQRVAPEGVFVTVGSLADIPLYNADVETAGPPEGVYAFADAIRAADAVLFVSPEYNRGVPGVLKNAIDWVSRQTVQTPLRHKPVGVVGVSTGAFGTIRGQAELKNLLAGSIGAYVMHQPDLMVSGAQQKFDDRGALIDPETEQRLGDYLAALVTWTQRVLAIDAIKALGGDGV